MWCLSRIPDPNPDFFSIRISDPDPRSVSRIRIPDLGAQIHRIPDPDPKHCSRPVLLIQNPLNSLLIQRCGSEILYFLTPGSVIEKKSRAVIRKKHLGSAKSYHWISIDLKCWIRVPRETNADPQVSTHLTATVPVPTDRVEDLAPILSCQWIRIRIPNPDPNPGGQKWPTKVENF